MFNNVFYYVNHFFVEICIDFRLYMLSIIVLRKKIGICKNRYRQGTLTKNRNRPRKLQSCFLSPRQFLNSRKAEHGLVFSWRTV